jgi:hypothetical protein
MRIDPPAKMTVLNTGNKPAKHPWMVKGGSPVERWAHPMRYPASLVVRGVMP